MSIVPLGIEFAGSTVLVVGGGPVAARKSRRFVRAGADVVVLSPEFASVDFGTAATGADGSSDPGTVEKIRAEPRANAPDAADWVDRTDPLLVVCATDDASVNSAFATAATEAGVLRNRADVAGSEDAGSVVVPATVTDYPVVVSVSTGGTSPALSAYLRERIEGDIEGAGAMAALSGDIRAELKARGVEPAVRRAAVRTVVSDQSVWKALRSGNTNARQVADAVVESVVGTQGST